MKQPPPRSNKNFSVIIKITISKTSVHKWILYFEGGVGPSFLPLRFLIFFAFHWIKNSWEKITRMVRWLWHTQYDEITWTNVTKSKGLLLLTLLDNYQSNSTVHRWELLYWIGQKRWKFPIDLCRERGIYLEMTELSTFKTWPLFGIITVSDFHSSLSFSLLAVRRGSTSKTIMSSHFESVL